MRRESMELKGSKTEQNLLTAFAGESQARHRYSYFGSQAKKEVFEQIEMYPAMAKTALEDGFEEIAKSYRSIAVVERQHEKRYNELLANVREGKVFKKDEPVKWKCRNCGYVNTGTEAPETCPACKHSRSHFELLAENWEQRRAAGF